MEDWKENKSKKEKNITIIKTDRLRRCIICHNRIEKNTFCLMLKEPIKRSMVYYMSKFSSHSVGCHPQCIERLSKLVIEEYQNKLSMRV